MTLSSFIFHIAKNSDIDNYHQSDHYTCESLGSEGFIHCCEASQLAGVVSRYYEAVDDIQLITLDPDKLDAALVRENTLGGSELFPHLYGPINKAAIVEIKSFGLTSVQRTGLFE